MKLTYLVNPVILSKNRNYGNIKACCYGSFCAEAQLAYEYRGKG